MKRILPLIFAMAFTASVAAPVDRVLSLRYAGNFIASMPHIFKGSFFVSGEDSILVNGECVLRIYHLSPRGFIVIAADDRSFPVPAFSADGNYTDDNLPGIKLFVNKWKSETAENIGKNVSASQDIISMWDKLARSEYIFLSGKQQKSVTPLLTTQWNQDYPYNIACPPDANGSGGYTYAGCVATAMGQIMFYHRWPETGTGSYTYNHPDYGTISADFAATAYDWNAMPNIVNNENTEVAKLLHHIGVSVDMDYGPDGSGMWNHHAALSYKTFFKYCPETRYIFRDSTTLNWDSLVVTNLQDKKPLYYAGWSDTTFTSGHAFVCDGYETNDYYHFNWGWGGQFDGYFYTGQMNPGGANFNLLQELVVDIYPDTISYTYPANCQGLKEITTPAGTISDGSGLNNYPAGSDCSWWINPSCGLIPEISFDQFELNSNDTLYIFEGTPSSHYLIDFYTGNNQPFLNTNLTPTILRTDSSSFYIVFRSNGQNNGFVLSYNTTFCLANDTITDGEGIISDGSRTCDYKKSTNCRWYIEVPGAGVYHFTTEEFGLYANSTAHSLTIYKESISSANQVYKFTSTNPPPASFYIEASKLYFRFLTTSTGTGQGWTFNYVATPLSATTSNYNNMMVIFPNPVTDGSEIIFGDNTGNAVLSLYDISGKLIRSSEIENGVRRTELKTVFPGLKPGYYLLQLSSEKGKYTSRFVKD